MYKNNKDKYKQVTYKIVNNKLCVSVKIGNCSFSTLTLDELIKNIVGNQVKLMFALQKN